MVKQKFMQFFDVNTTPDSFSIFTVKAGGEIIHKRLAPFFQAYKYFKLGRVNVKCVPASTLPVDPTGLSYEAGENTIDPRDQFNPGLIRITNGEEVAPVDQFNQNRYYATMLDPRWYKFRLQSGFQRSAVPLVWNVAENGQHMYPSSRFIKGFDGKLYQISQYNYTEPNDDAAVPVPVKAHGSAFATGGNYLKAGSTYVTVTNATSGTNSVTVNNSSASLANGQLYIDSGDIPSSSNISDLDGAMMAGEVADNWVNAGTTYPIQNRRERLGWMPTDFGGVNEAYAEYVDPLGTVVRQMQGYSGIPEVDLMTFVFPKAFKTKYYYRIFVETTVYFKDPVVIDPFIDEASSVIPVDRFVTPGRIGGAPYPGGNDYQ